MSPAIISRETARRFTAGFTLIEMAMVLFIISLVLGGVFEMATLMMKRAETRDTEDKVALMKERILGYVLTNQRLPEYGSGTGVDQITALGFANRDRYGQKLNYLYDPQLVRTDLDSVVCSKKSTNLSVRYCTDSTCTTPVITNNMAFVVFSKGPNAANQTGAATTPHTEVSPDLSYSGPDGSAATPKQITVYGPGVKVGIYSDPTNNVSDYDDVVSLVTLDEMRQRQACQGVPLRIANSELPMGAQNTTYAATIYADGGVPISPATNGRFRWCAESTVAASVGTIAVLETLTGAVTAPVTVLAAGSCIVATENSVNWVQGDSLRVRGQGASPVNSLTTTTAGTFDIKVFARDDQNVTAALLTTTDPADNIVAKQFVLAISGS
jgi:prepilin-type N-terminal cleavage/methylation domain-containing protein